MWVKSLVLVSILFVSLSAAAARGDEEDPPSMEILEFLADWETDEGEWIDPTTLDQMSLPDQEQEDDEEKPE
jgi:hypothetical protein